MKHWKTNEKMGKGFYHTKKEHKKYNYNYLVYVEKHERNTLRTHYLIRDIWNIEQLKELKEFLEEQITERELTS
tara:strand:- start:303 stop:524 length:222 start_codon:yes stop_codon:yes gene_type:complete